jgi:hypothetical protein
MRAGENRFTRNRKTQVFRAFKTEISVAFYGRGVSGESNPVSAQQGAKWTRI